MTSEAQALRRISLNEAVTSLAFGKARKPEQEVAQRRADQHAVRELVAQCQSEAAGNDEFRAFQKSIPYHPLSFLKNRLENTRDQWPPSAKALYALVKRLEQKWARYDAKYQAVLDRIFEAASEGEVQLVGRTAQHRSAPVHLIEPKYFLGAVTINHQRAHVGPTVVTSGSPRAGGLLMSGPGLLPIYYDVMISRVSLSSLPPPDQRTRQLQDQKETEKELRSWYRGRARIWPKGRPPPPRDADEAEARARFPRLRNRRDLVRELRLECWDLRKGRPKLAKK